MMADLFWDCGELEYIRDEIKQLVSECVATYAEYTWTENPPLIMFRPCSTQGLILELLGPEKADDINDVYTLEFDIIDELKDGFDFPPTSPEQAEEVMDCVKGLRLLIVRMTALADEMEHACLGPFEPSDETPTP
jgi:hypothetical protein